MEVLSWDADLMNGGFFSLEYVAAVVEDKQSDGVVLCGG